MSALPTLRAAFQCHVVESGALRRRVGTSSLTRSASADSTRIRLEAAVPANARRVDLILDTPARRAWRLTSDRRLREVSGHETLVFPAGCFLVIEADGALFRLDLRFGRGHWVEQRADGTRFGCTLLHRDGTGLVHWRQEPSSPTADHDDRPVAVTVVCHRLDTVADCIWLEPYPGGARAAVCLTDHADHDSTEKLLQVQKLFERSGVRITKSVFPRSDPRPSQQKFEPGLDQPDFRAVVERMRGAENEIAYHSFGPRTGCPDLAEAQVLARSMATFGTTTWIDHGRGAYNFAFENVIPPATSLTGFLADYGVQNYWSHLDIYENPFRSRSIWSPVPRQAPLADLGRSLPRASSKSFPYLVLHALNNVAGVEGVLEMRRRGNSFGRAYTAVGRSWRELNRLHSMPMVIYGEDGTPPEVGQGSPWVFDTVLLNHLAWQLAPRALEALEASSGLLLAHCYLCAEEPYMTGHTFARPDGAPTLTGEFVATIEALGDRQAAGGIVTLPFDELRRSLESFTSASLARTEQGWTVTAGGDRVPTIGWTNARLRPVDGREKPRSVGGTKLLTSDRRAVALEALG